VRLSVGILDLGAAGLGVRSIYGVHDRLESDPLVYLMKPRS
jgi:hypothetical protein